MHRLRIELILAALLVGTTHAQAGGNAVPDDDERFGRGRFHAGLSIGYGHGYDPEPGPQDRVRMLAVAPHLGAGLTDPLGGDAWYRGNLDLSLEPQFLVNFEPESGFGGGASLYLRYQFLTRRRVVPFAGAGVGMLGLNFDGAHQADGFSFVAQAGLGAHVLLTRRAALTLDARWHHISNAGLRSPNSGIDSVLVLVGATWFLR